MTFGEKLYELRTGRGMSQDALAELTGVSRQAVSKWERDEAMPDVDKIVRLSDVFSVTTDYLLKDAAAENTAGNTAERQPRYVREPDVFDKIGELVKTKWYVMGYVLAAWGALDVVRLILFALSAGGIITGSIAGAVTGMMGLGFGFAPMLYVFLVPVLKLGGGIFLAVWGKKKCMKGW